MSDALAAALERLADVLGRDVSDRRQRDRDAKYADPEFQAELEALRRPLRKMPFGAFVRSVPGLGEAFAVKVPSNFWALNEGVVDVSCPCSALPHPDQWPAPCPGAERNGCPRWYLFDGENVRVAFSPRGGAPAPQDDDLELLTG